jgi:hypothetical protein
MSFCATACVTLALGTLGVGALPATVDAQTDRPVATRAARPPLEFGGQTSLVAIFPGFGALVSAPVERGIAVEAGVETLPWMIEGGDELRLLTQLQARLPWRQGPRSRRSFVVGASLATVGGRGARGFESLTTVLPHAGLSWQWQQSPRVDVRLDLQALVPMGLPGIPAPRVAFAIIGHRRGGRL